MFDRVAEGRWWDRAWSLVEGCTPCSPGCDRCWLRSMDRRFKRAGSVLFREERLALPRRTRKPTAFAVWSDLFHEAVNDEQICVALRVAGDAARHRFLILTKRAERMAHFSAWTGAWPANCWLGVTVCNQQEADEKIPLLLKIPAKVRFISYEPALGPVDFCIAAFNGADSSESLEGIHWVIAGGESGPSARPAHPDWFRSVRNQCRAAAVPFFFKGWGEWVGLKVTADKVPVGESIFCQHTRRFIDPRIDGEGLAFIRVGRKRAGRRLDGRTWDELPAAAAGGGK